MWLTYIQRRRAYELCESFLSDCMSAWANGLSRPVPRDKSLVSAAPSWAVDARWSGHCGNEDVELPYKVELPSEVPCRASPADDGEKWLQWLAEWAP